MLEHESGCPISRVFLREVGFVLFLSDGANRGTINTAPKAYNAL